MLAHELAHLVRGDLWTNWLLLLARTLCTGSIPLAWWTIREMQAEREAACDELALAALGETDRSAYASTIIDLAASLAPSGIGPGDDRPDLFDSPVDDSHRASGAVPFSTSLRAPLAAGIVLGIALTGLTDAMPAAAANQSSAKSAPSSRTEPEPLEAKTVTLRGRCVDHVDNSPLAGSHGAVVQGTGTDLADCRNRENRHRSRRSL